MADEQWQAAAALVDPVRRSLYDHVRRQRRPVTREEAAAAVTISRNLTAFHLDKLVEAGLLRARFEAPAGRRRGRGRAPKVYEPTDGGVALTIPPRRYDIVGEILAGAVAEDPEHVREAAVHNAADLGQRLGSSRPPTDAPDLAAASDTLTDLGFEPRSDGPGALQLANCPFHALATRHPELICGINTAFVGGVLTGLCADSLTARLQPTPGACCVRVEPIADNGEC